MPDFGPALDLPDEDAVLREVAAMDLALARRFYGEAMAEPDPETAAHLTRAYNRVTRSLRQCLALRAKLAQDWETHAFHHGRREEAEPARPARPARPAQPASEPEIPELTRPAPHPTDLRRTRLRHALTAIIWNERETEQFDYRHACVLRNRLDDELDAACGNPDFAADPLEAHVAAICQRYGIRPYPDWPSLKPAPDFWLYPSEPYDPPDG